MRHNILANIGALAVLVYVGKFLFESLSSLGPAAKKKITSSPISQKERIDARAGAVGVGLVVATVAAFLLLAYGYC